MNNPISFCEDGDTLTPGQTREVDVTITAPFKENTYTFKYQLKNI
jgi:hypothetical protein